MQKARALGLAAILALVATAGCFGGDEVPPVKTVSASGGLASDGYAYDGQGLEEASAELSGFVHDPDDRGSLNASFEFAGSTWEITYQSFSGQEDFKDGGVEFGLVEHGDSGTSTPIIPTIDGEIVTYGTATVLRDGQPATDPQGNSGPWSAHLMLSHDTIRGPDGLITKADGSTPYDPSSPGDARIIEDDPQALLQLTAPSGPDSARAPATTNETLTVQGPGSSASTTIGAAQGATAVINVTASGGSSPLGVGNVQIQITDGNQTLDRAEGMVQPNQDFTASFELADLNTSSLGIVASGNGTFEVEIGATVTYDDHPFIILTWDDYQTEGMDAVPGS